MPDQDSLIVEAQIGVEDISDVHPNMRAEVHLTAYKQRIVPIIHGDVIQVSADRLTDPKTDNPYYTALVRVDEQELAALPNIRLYPGMPATVMIPTTETDRVPIHRRAAGDVVQSGLPAKVTRQIF